MKTITLFIVALFIQLSSLAQVNILKPSGYITLVEISKPLGTKVNLFEEGNSKQFVLSLAYGTVVDEGGIITSNGKILIDTQTSKNNSQYNKLLRKGYNITDENPMFLKGRLAVISSPGQENWYHFLLQVLPRIKILKESKVEFDKIYINNLRYQFQRDALNHVLDVLQIPKYKILEINGDAIVQAETLIVPSVPFIPVKDTALPVWMKTFLRDSFLNNPNANPNGQSAAQKIYILRAKASIRQIENEKELTDNLKRRGFKIVYLEELSPFKQAQLFNNAKVIVGPHGSGFANLIFARPKTKVIEIYHESFQGVRSFLC